MNLKELLLDLVNVVVEEAEKNPEFQKQLEGVFEKHTGVTTVTPLETPSVVPTVPSILEEYLSMGEAAYKAKLTKMKVADCRELAMSNGISLPKGNKTVKADCIKTILDWMKARASGENKQKEEKEDNTQEEKPGGTQAADPVEGETEDKKEEEKTRDVSDINPILIFYKEGSEKLKAILEELTVEELHLIIRQRSMDSQNRTRKWKTKAKLVEHILLMAESRASQGDVFRNYKR